jgi:flagellar motor switch protein FliG
MGITDRHKKPGGFKKLVQSLEITAPEKRKKILDSMRVEDPIFASDVEKSLFDFSEFMKIDDLVLCEIISEIKDMKALAIALYKAPNEWIEKFKKNMVPAKYREFKEETELLSQTPVTVGMQMSSRYKIISIARELQNQKKIVLKPYDSKYPDEL